MTLVLGIVSPLAFAYPDKPIRIVVPFVAGGGTDITARLIGNELSKAFKRAVIVENRPGADTIVAMQIIARAEPDGHTIGMVTNAHSLNQAIKRSMPFDPVKDFAGVSMLVTSPFVLVANPSLKVRSVADLVAKAKREPGAIFYASSGANSVHFLATEWLSALAEIKMVHVPYNGMAPALADLVAGHVGVMFTGVSSGMPFVRRNQLDALAVAPAQGVVTEPNIPSVARSGYPGFDFNSWFGFVVPAGTPTAILDRLNREIRNILAKPEVSKRLIKAGLFPVISTRPEFDAFMARDVQMYVEILEKTKIKIAQ